MSKRIALGVTGSIAAYKAADITSSLTQAGHEVTVIMSKDAQRFITPLPFKTLSRRAVITDLYDEEEGWKPAHIRVADEAELLLIAPATAKLIAHLALGLADDALTCIALALNPACPILIAPAMNGKMWQHPATMGHVQTLKDRGVHFIGPTSGMLSCGYEGIGRMAKFDEIVDKALDLLSKG